VLVFSERWRQRLACILWEAELVFFERQRQRQVWHELLNQENSAQLNEASGSITGKWGHYSEFIFKLFVWMTLIMGCK